MGSDVADINNDAALLSTFETIRAHAAVRMGLIKAVAEAATRQHTPKIAFVAPPTAYTASSGKRIEVGDVDVLVRALSMGKLHHAMMATCAVAIATASSVPGTLVNLAAGGQPREAVRGRAARITLYMAQTYGVRLSDQDRKLMCAWARTYPVDDWERERNLTPPSNPSPSTSIPVRQTPRQRNVSLS